MKTDDDFSKLVSWPPLHAGHNEPGPTDLAGEYRASEQLNRGQPNAGPGDKLDGARVPGELRAYEQPVDVASDTELPPERDKIALAERSIADARHIARGKPNMASA